MWGSKGVGEGGGSAEEDGTEEEGNVRTRERDLAGVDAIAGSRGWFPRVAFNHPEAMNILFDGQFR